MAELRLGLGRCCNMGREVLQRVPVLASSDLCVFDFYDWHVYGSISPKCLATRPMSLMSTLLSRFTSALRSHLGCPG